MNKYFNIIKSKLPKTIYGKIGFTLCLIIPFGGIVLFLYAIFKRYKNGKNN